MHWYYYPLGLLGYVLLLTLIGLVLLLILEPEPCRICGRTACDGFCE